MKITYKENPLMTTVELDEFDKTLFWHKLKIEALEDRLFSTHFYLSEEYFDLKRAQSESNADEHDTSEGRSKFDKHIDKMCEYFIGELLDIHIGDCTCCPSSCSKCHAEYLLGVDTIKGLRKHEANLIGSLFGSGPTQPQRSLDEVIALLEEMVKTPIVYDESKVGKSWPLEDRAAYEYHIPRWTQERVNALEWLKSYKAEHFS